MDAAGESEGGFNQQALELEHTTENCKWTDSISGSLIHHCLNLQQHSILNLFINVFWSKSACGCFMLHFRDGLMQRCCSQS